MGDDVTRTHADRAVPPPAESRELPRGDPQRFVVAHEHARGGLGRVLAAHDQALDRPVAIKQLLAPGPDRSARFHREARVTARLQHPGIVPVYEAGTWPDGEPYYVMKLVAGRSLKEAIAGDLRARLALVPHVIAVAEAVAYAHAHDVVHRDLKPSNVVLGEFGETVVIDWGLAIRRGDEQGGVVGTPSYMPPEQARGEPVDARADIYALGAMLYHVLAGHAPGDAIAGPRKPLVDAPVELAAIVARAMAREPAARYPTARAFADDLGRYRTGQLVGSHRYSTWSLVARWVQRHRLPVLLSAAFVIALAVVGAIAISRVTSSRRAAEDRGDHLVLLQARDSIDRDPAGAIAWLETYRGDDFRAVRALFEEARGRGAVAIVPGVLDGAINSTRDNHFRALLADGRVADIDPRTGATTARPMFAPPDRVSCASIAAGGELAAIADPRGFTLVDLVHGTSRRIDVPANVELARESCAFTADGSAFGFGLSTGLGWLRVADGALTTFAGEPASSFARSPDGASIVWTGWPRRTVRVVDVASKQEIELATGESGPRFVDFSPDGARIIAVTRAGDLFVWRRTGEFERTVHACPFAVSNGAWLARGLAVHCEDGTVPVIDVATGATEVLGPSGPNWGWAGAADAKRLVALGRGGGAAWNVTTGQLAPIAFDDDVEAGWFTPDGSAFAIAAVDSNNALVFRTPPLDTHVLPGHAGNLSKALLSPDGRIFVQTLDDGISLCDPACTPLPTGATPNWIAFGDNARIGYATDRESGWFEVADKSRHAVGGAIVSGAWSPAGDRVALGESERRLRVIDARTGAARTIETGELAYDLAWSPDGRRVAWRDEHGIVGVADVDGERRWRFEGDVPVNGLSFTPALAFARDGQRLYGGGPHGALATWDLETGTTAMRTWHALEIMAIVLSPDGHTLATASNDRTVRLLDLATGEATELAGHHAEIWQLAFSQDGSRLASGARDSTVRVWDIRTGDVAVLRGHTAEVRSLSLVGDRLVSASADRAIVWDLARLPPPLADAASVRAALDVETSVVLGPDDRATTLILAPPAR